MTPINAATAITQLAKGQLTPQQYQAQLKQIVQQNIGSSASSGGSSTSSATNPFKWLDYATQANNYQLPQVGASRYTTTFNSLGTTGLGKNNSNPLDINTWGAGLWAAGIDPNDPNLGYRLWEFNKAKMSSNDTDYQKRVQEQVAKHGWDLNTKEGLSSAVDWYYRDLSRRMDKSNNFFDSTIGKIISMTAPLALGGVGAALGLSGSLVGAGTGAVIGGVQGGPLGAVLGGVGGYGAGSLAGSLVNNGISGTIDNITSGFQEMFGGGATTAAGQAAGATGSGVNAAANAVPGLSTGVTTPMGGGAIIGSGTAAPLAGIAGGAALGASPLAVAGGAAAATPAIASTASQLLQAAASNGGTGITTSVPGTPNTPVPGTNQVATGAQGASGSGSGATTNAATTAAGAAGATGTAGTAASGTSTMQKILSALGGTGGLGTGAISLLQGILGQMSQGDLEAMANKLNQNNQALLDYMPPMSYRDNILNNLNMIMNNPSQLMTSSPYKDYMDYAQRAVERKMVAQGYGGVGQSTNTADAVTRAVMESMSGIVQKDREIATNQLEPFFRVAMTGAGGMNSSAPIELNMAANAGNADSWRQILQGGASILNSTGILQDIFG